MDKMNKVALKFFTSACSAFITFFLLGNVGIDISNVNIFTISTFSTSFFVLWVICFYTIEKFATKSFKFLGSFYLLLTKSSE